MAQTVVELSGDERKLLRSYQKVRDAENQMTRGLKGTKRARNEAFGQKAAQEVRNFALQFFGVQKALQTVQQLYQKVRQEREKDARSQQQAFGGIGSLAQLARDPEHLRYLVSEARKTYRVGATKSEGAAGALQFALTSAELGEYRESVAQLQASGVVQNAKALVDAAAAMEAALGRKETGRFREIVSKAFGASRGAPATVEQILERTALVGAQAKELGLSDEQLLAAIATIAKVSGPERAGTQLQSMLKQIERFAIPAGAVKRGQTLTEMVAGISGQVGEGANIQDILGGRQEAIVGYRTLKDNMSRFQDNIRNVNQAMEDGAFEQKVNLATNVIPSLMAEQARRKAEAQRTLAGGPQATLTNLAEAIIDEQTAEMKQRTMGGWRAGANEMIARMSLALRGPRAFVREKILEQERAERRGLKPPIELSEGLLETYQEITEQLNNAAANLEDASFNSRRQREAVQGVSE